MKTIMALLVILVGAFAVFAQSNGGPVTPEIVKGVDRALTEALLKGDTAKVNQILGEDYLEVTAQGLVRNKSDIMAIVRARESAPKAVAAGPEVSVTELQVRVYSQDVAVLTGLRTTKYQHMEYQVAPGSGQLPPPDFTDKERFMKVYVRRSNLWRLVSSQTTNVATGLPSTKSLPKS